MIARETGIPTLSDFRSDDVALGGRGAPLTPVLDLFLFQKKKVPSMFINLGGFTNITIIKSERDFTATDCGPGNVLINYFARKYLDSPMDRGGRISRKGKPHSGLLRELCRHPFLGITPPKSVGRVDFGKSYLDKIYSYVKVNKIGVEHTFNTICKFMVKCIRELVDTHMPDEYSRVKIIVISGGGMHNRAISRYLEELFPEIPVVDSGYFGIEPDFKEAVLMALIGYNTFKGKTSSFCKVTGASRDAVLGTLSLP